MRHLLRTAAWAIILAPGLAAPRMSAGVEYYSELGTLTDFEPVSDQHHILLPAIDLDVSPDWELNSGVGYGLTDTSEHWILKAIVGHRFKF